MKLIITNLLPYPRQVQYFRRNQTVVLGCRESMATNDIIDENESSYYFSLRNKGFKVCVDNDLSGFSIEELKRIVQNLGIVSRARVRDSLESIIHENLSCDASVFDYLY